jgi:clan AA aspartic protease
MSIFRFPIEIADSTGERFQPVDAWVDTGASYTLVPGTLLEGLGHTSDHNLRFGKADGSITELGVSQVTIRINGETRVVFGGDDAEPLLGATALEEFALGVDPLNHTLVPVVLKLLGFIPESNED